MEKLRRQFGEIEYISVIEPQANGRWHCHVLLKAPKKLTIPNDKINELWNKGYSKTQRLRKSDKIANYLMAYLTNLDIPTGVEPDSKKFVKGARLYLYPKGVRIYRRSSGIQDPIEQTASKQMILENNNVISRPADFARYVEHQTPNGKISYTTEFFNNID